MEARNENEIAVSIPLEDVEKIEIRLEIHAGTACKAAFQLWLEGLRRQFTSIFRSRAPTSKLMPKSSACHSIYMKKGK